MKIAVGSTVTLDFPHMLAIMLDERENGPHREVYC